MFSCSPDVVPSLPWWWLLFSMLALAVFFAVVLLMTLNIRRTYVINFWRIEVWYRCLRSIWDIVLHVSGSS